ncbi:ecotropic viral integration site 5 ortholog [Galendromus occidentalis]|uniref:Ecotropic viral integration site 5 ortholog n=1 Tax=Galendromus occidentalis TaxID=34638 RepID=A0AAJ7SGW3_9ACAR|nr:ecotropic viral integration site 5 ortholog [Galendromus occidentalis]
MPVLPAFVPQILRNQFTWSESGSPDGSMNSSVSVESSPCHRKLNGDLSRTKDVSKDEIALLQKLEEQNRLLEKDAKSLSSLTSTGHSRRSSDTSQISVNMNGSSCNVSGANSMDDTEDDLLQQWGKLVQDYENLRKRKPDVLKDAVRKGIPPDFRAVAWQLFTNATTCNARDQYHDYLKGTSPCEKVIRRDIARTYPDQEFFREKNGPGQEALFNVMKAYSLHDREVGYCQGSAFIVGLLLLYMPELETFTVLVRMMSDYRLRDVYKPSMAELGLYMFQLECLVQELLPELNTHFQSQSFHTSMYASSWFLTLFTSVLPMPVATRCMDLFLSEGIEMVFRLGIAILQICKEDILLLDMEEMIKYFQKEMPSKVSTDVDYLVSLAVQVKYNAKRMKKLEKEYQAIKARETEEQIELRRLRTENRILRQRVENLEQESSSLADRLIQGQVDHAQATEENYFIKRQLAAVKEQGLHLSMELENQKEKVQELIQSQSNPSSLTNGSTSDDLSRALQDELVAVKLREAENLETMKQLQNQIEELETENKRLHEQPTPENSVAALQEELIAVKLREAEAHLGLKELKQNIADLQLVWQKHIEQTGAQITDLPEATKLEQQILSLRLREAEVQAEVQELRAKVMELEAQNQVSVNQVRRQAEELKTLQQEKDKSLTRERELESQLREATRKYTDLEGTLKEERMNSKIKECEQDQLIAELKQRISSLEIKNQELVTVGELSKGSSDSDEVKDLQDKLSDTKAEVLRLKVINKQLNSALSMPKSTQQKPSQSGCSTPCDFNLGSNTVSEESITEQLLQLGVDLSPNVEPLTLTPSNPPTPTSGQAPPFPGLTASPATAS